MSWNQNGLSSDSHLTLEAWHLSSWCHIPNPPKTFQYLQSLQLSLHTFLLCIPEHWRVPGERRVTHEELNWDSISLSVLLRMDSAGVPAALSQSWCLRIFNVWNLREAETFFTLTTRLQLISEATAVFSTWAICTSGFAKKKKSLFRMSMYELEF